MSLELEGQGPLLMAAFIAPLFATLVVITLAVGLAFYVAAVAGDVGAALYLVGVLVSIALSLFALSVAHNLAAPWLQSRRSQEGGNG